MSSVRIAERVAQSPGRAIQEMAQNGAAASVLLAVSPLLEGVGGKYFRDCNEAVVVSQRPPEDERHKAVHSIELNI